MKYGGVKNVSFGESKKETKTVRQTLHTLLLKTTKKGKKKSVILNSKNARNHSITLKVVCQNSVEISEKTGNRTAI